MPKLIITCDEKWPVYDLEVPEEGQEPNCELPEDFYREYLFIMTNYYKIQKILKRYHDESIQRINEQYPYSFPEGTKLDRNYTFNTIGKGSETT